jgi:S1-C subfamily serine protease
MNVSAAPISQRRELGSLLRSVVKVLCVSDSPDYEQPWQSQGPASVSGSGAVIETRHGLRVLTNAHCVSNHKFVELRRYGKSQRFEAEVEAIGHECDLALLKVTDESIFQGATPIPIGELPRLSDRVSVCGYPIGGEKLSITEGIVSRIELVSYAQSNRHLLAVQIDAAINSGNSGGPVIKDGELVGVAFQALDEAESVGYMIAPEVVQHFLSDVATGSYKGFPSVGAVTQSLESPAQRRALGLRRDREGGVLVTRVAYGGSAWGVLEEGDVLLAVDHVPIAADGTTVLREGELIHFRYVISKRHVGERVPVTVWRRGQEITCVLEMREARRLVVEDRYDVRPSYFIYGGLLLVPLTRDYLKTWGESWGQTAPREFVALYENGLPSESCQQVVVLQKVLADRVNQGYHEFENLMITRFNGEPVRSLAQLVESIDSCTSRYVELEAHTGQRLVLDRHEAEARQGVILAKFGVPAARSIDLVRAQPHQLSLQSAIPFPSAVQPAQSQGA